MTMAKEREPITVPPDGEVARLLDAVAKTPVLLTKDGRLYQLTPATADDPVAGYDPAAVQAAVASTAGSWADLDTEALKALLVRARDEGTRPE
jgi:hypothetical protein